MHFLSSTSVFLTNCVLTFATIANLSSVSRCQLSTKFANGRTFNSVHIETRTGYFLRGFLVDKWLSRQISRRTSFARGVMEWVENVRSNAEGSCGSSMEIAARVAENPVAPILLFGRPSGCNCVGVVAFAGARNFRGVRGN